MIAEGTVTDNASGFAVDAVDILLGSGAGEYPEGEEGFANGTVESAFTIVGIKICGFWEI